MLESQLAQALCAHAVQGDFRQAGQLIAAERSAGRSLVSILLELIQPAARELGRGWDSDTLSFAEVTVASGVLRRLMAEELGRSPSSAATRAGADPAPSAMFVALPGCQHRIGLGMIGAIFGLAGWRTAIADDQPLEPLLRRIVHFKPALLGLSLGSDFELERASEFILRVRHVSDRSNPVIMVGGPAVILRPDTAAALGADLVGGDALDALKQAARRLEEPRFESV
jgi:methanogenic corrinoid protein MtbC1